MADKQLDLKDEYLGALLILADSNEFAVYQKMLDQQIEVRKKTLVNLVVFDQETMAKQNVLHGEILGLTTAKLIPVHAKSKVEDERLMKQAFEQDGPEFKIDNNKKDEDK